MAQSDGLYIFDLHDPGRRSLNVDKQWIISFPAPKRLWFIPARRIQKNVVLSVQDIVCPECWKVEKGELFSAQIADHFVVLGEGKEEKVTLSSAQTYFQLFLNTMAVKDCRERQVNPIKTYPLSFCVVLTDEKKKEVCRVARRIQVQFSEVHASPVVEILLDQPEIMYNSTLAAQPYKIGILKLSNHSGFDYFPFLDCDFVFEAYDGGKKLAETCLYLDNDPESNSHSNTVGHIGLQLHEHKQWDIYANFLEIGNPHEKDTREIEMRVSVKYRYTDDSQSEFRLPDKSAVFVLRRDPQLAELFVQVRDTKTGSLQELKNGGLVRLSTFAFLPGNHQISRNELILSNLAENGAAGTGVAIKNFGCIFQILPERHTLLLQTKKLDQSAFFKLEGNFLEQLSQGHMLESKGANTSVVFGFKGDDIKYVFHELRGEKFYNLVVRCVVAFDYYINNAGYLPVDHILPEEYSKFSAEIELPIEQQPYQDWLGIDFGTSAIVCQYGRTLLDLHSVRSELFQDSSNDNYEDGTPFLPSNLVLRHNVLNPAGSQLLTDYDQGRYPDFKNLVVCLSPTSLIEDSNFRSILPCLKLMAGYRYLPDITRYAHVRYKRSETGGGIVDDRIVTVEGGETVCSSLAEVDKVFEEVYKQLFVYYVKEALRGEDAGKINQVVLTVPNTYTPVHLKRLKECVRLSFSELYIRNIRFVSESDAVACYYQKNWKPVNKQIGREVENSGLENQENILVYDMGAGTLDVTLLSKTREQERTEIRVLGKVGVAKAGNYLDFILAKLLAEKVKAFSVYAKTDLDADALVQARKLKKFVRDKLKPVLGIERQVTIPRNTVAGLKEEVSLEVDMLLEAPDFKQYIKDCTEGFLDNFFTFLGYTEPVKIDTVLVSGRSSKLKFIRENLELAVNKWSSHSNWSLIDMSELTGEGECDKSKTVVVEGALAYARNFSTPQSPIRFISNNILASYGVIYQDHQGGIKFQELLNHRQKPVATHEENGMIINEYQTEPVRLNLIAADEIRLVQTFSAKTGEDWVNGDREYITEMSAYIIPAEEDRAQVELSLVVDSNNVMTLWMNGVPAEGLAPSRADVNNKANQISLWPMASK